MKIILCLLLLLSFSCSKTESSFKLTLLPRMIINEVAKGDATMLIDEQGVGEGIAEQPVSSWTIKVPEGEPEWYLPANAVIDLGSDHLITRILLYDGEGKEGLCEVNYGIPFQWKNLFSDSLRSRNTWNEHPVGDITTRFLQISKKADADLREIILYGYPLKPQRAGEDSQRVIREKVPLEQAIGVNTHYLDPIERVKAAGIVREYHNWMLNEGGFTKDYQGYPDNAIRWNPANALLAERNTLPDGAVNLDSGFMFDRYYAALKEAGVIVFPCIQGTVAWLNGEPNMKSRHKPVLVGKDPAVPASYAAHADFMYQYAARYGSSKVPEQMLKAETGQRKRSGLGYLEFYENWNEPDGWWGGRADYFTPYEYAAMSSADYDGHESAIGKDKGIKNADPDAKLVMSGIAIPNVDYLKAMKFWFDHNRGDKKFVFDVITVHHYCNERGSQAVMSKGISPEEDGLRNILRKVVDFRDQYAPHSEVWFTEFGWDTNPITPQSAPSKEVQGQWLVRAYLAAFGAGMDRVLMYMLRDVDPKSKIQFSSSGLIGPVGDFSVKPSWYYVYTLRNQLSGLVFESQTEGSVSVNVYKFKSLKGDKRVYALWSPTHTGKVVKNFSIPVDETVQRATVVALKDGETNGEVHPLRIRNATITLDVSESPVFVNLYLSETAAPQ